MSDYDLLFKVMLVGDSGTGKTSILLRFSDNYFTDSFQSTIGVEFRIRTIQVDNLFIFLKIWDAAGQERFRTLISAYYKCSNAVLVVFDKSNRESFDHLDMWVEEIKKYAPDDVTIMFVGNMCNMESEVSTEEAQEKALKYNAHYIDVSSKTNEHIDFMFIILARMLIEMQKGFT